jgi:hypothetical protein
VLGYTKDETVVKASVDMGAASKAGSSKYPASINVAKRNGGTSSGTKPVKPTVSTKKLMQTRKVVEAALRKEQVKPAPDERPMTLDVLHACYKSNNGYQRADSALKMGDVKSNPDPKTSIKYWNSDKQQICTQSGAALWEHGQGQERMHSVPNMNRLHTAKRNAIQNAQKAVENNLGHGNLGPGSTMLPKYLKEWYKEERKIGDMVPDEPCRKTNLHVNPDRMVEINEEKKAADGMQGGAFTPGAAEAGKIARLMKEKEVKARDKCSEEYYAQKYANLVDSDSDE